MLFRSKTQIFDNNKVRSVWDRENEKWYFAIVDVVAVLTESADPFAYWRKLLFRRQINTSFLFLIRLQFFMVEVTFHMVGVVF